MIPAQSPPPSDHLGATYFSLGELLEAQRKVPEAIQAYEQALQINPNLGAAHSALGPLLRKQGQTEAAIAHYQKAIQQSPQAWQLHQQLALVFFELGQYGEAVKAYQNAIAIQPDHPTLHHQLGVVQEQQGKLKAACNYYRQAITLDANYAPAYNHLGCTLGKLNEFDPAIKDLQTAIRLQPQKATYYNNLGQVFWWQHKNRDAIVAYRKAIQLHPNYTLAYYNLGLALQVEALHRQAATAFEKVLQLDSHYFAAYGDWGISLMQIGEIEKALQSWKILIAAYQEQCQSYQEWVETRIGSPQDAWESARVACAQFLKALQQSNFTQAQQDLQQIYCHLGDATAEYGNPQQAEVYYQRALRLQPKDSTLQIRLANSLVTQGRIESAIALYRTALTVQPDTPSARFQLAKLLENKGKWQSAIEYYQELWLQAHQLEVGSSPSPGIAPPQESYATTESWLRATNQLDQKHYIDLGGTNTQPRETRNSARIMTCQGLNCLPCLNQLSRCFEPTELDQDIHVCTFPQDQPVASPPRFVARIPQGRAWAIPQENHWLICKAFAVITPDHYVLQDVSRHYPGQLPGCSQQGDPHDVFLQKTLPPITKVNGTVAVLTGLSGNVYFHWLVDILPRLALLEQSGIHIKQLDGIWINQVAQPFQRETLNILGIPLDKIISSDQTPHLEAQELIVPSFSGYLGWLSAWGLKFLRDRFLTPLLQENTTYPERIYIRRSGAKHRRVLNEEAVIDELKTRGFVPVSLETLSFQEQINCFAKAKIIIAPHGSGLTNLVFCSPQTKVIELFSPNYIRYYFWVISQQLALEHYFVTGESIPSRILRELMYQNPLSEDIWINLKTLKKTLDYAQIN